MQIRLQNWSGVKLSNLSDSFQHPLNIDTSFYIHLFVFYSCSALLFPFARPPFWWHFDWTPFFGNLNALLLFRRVPPILFFRPDHFLNGLIGAHFESPAPTQVKSLRIDFSFACTFSLLFQFAPIIFQSKPNRSKWICLIVCPSFFVLVRFWSIHFGLNPLHFESAMLNSKCITDDGSPCSAHLFASLHSKRIQNGSIE